MSAYLAKAPASGFNSSGRAFPDIASKADDFIIDANGFTYIVGTSAASPVAASIIALLNDRLASAGQAPLGFLNPWLYGTASAAFTDITTGNSSIGCGGEEYSLDAVEGWDPVSPANIRFCHCGFLNGR